MARRLLPLATALVFVWFFLACCYGIAGPWQWGHNGFNGSAFCQAARNSLRFHIAAQALYHTGLEPPPPAALYTHHPQMLHWHLIALFKVLGAAPWVGRLIPAAYSFATLVLLQRAAARWWGPAHALLATAIYALTPLHLVFANMIDHEQGAIFWTLALLFTFVRWWEERRARHFALALVSVSFAGQFDWPPYYVAFYLALFVLAAGLRQAGPFHRWRPEWTFLVVFSLVVLANFGGFFAWIAWTRGSLADMGSAYLLRTAAKVGYAAVQWRRLLDLHGLVIMALTVAWIPLIVARLRAKAAAPRDLLPGCFFAAQILHSLLFRNAGAIHSYWTYWLGVASALGGADVLVSAHRRLADDARRWHAPAFVAIAAVLGLLQARYAYARLAWGYAHGTAAYFEPTPDIRTEVRAMQALHVRYPREQTLFVFHGSMDVRAEVHWYHDSPMDGSPTVIPRVGLWGRAKHVVLLVDLRRAGERADLEALVRLHPTLVFERRIVAIELTGREATFGAFAAAPRPEGFWHRWFVDPAAPAVELVPDDPVAVKASFTWGEVAAIGQSGSAGGTLLAWDCPVGQHLGAIEASLDGAAIVRLRGRCRRVDGGPGEDTPFFGGPAAGTTAVACPAGQALVGFSARTATYLAGLAPRCASPSAVPREETSPGSVGVADGTPGEVSFSCPAGTVARGLRVRAGAMVDAFGIACAR